MFEGNPQKVIPQPDNMNKIPRRIVINFIPHNNQRYNTIGDYYESGQIGEVHINISEMKDKRYEFLVAIHELVEMCLCDVSGIKNDVIDNYDKKAEQQGILDPGMEAESPYHHEHVAATGVEMLLANEMNVNWANYEDHLEKVQDSYNHKT
jgi:hypothetical protein